MNSNPETPDRSKLASGSANAEHQTPTIDFLDWVLFIPFIVVFSAMMLLGDVLQRLVYPFSRRLQAQMVVLNCYGGLALLRFTGAKFRYDIRCQLQDDRPYIVISNHQSLFDIAMINTVFRKHLPRYIAKKELTKGIPSISFYLRHSGSALIDRSDPKQALPEIYRMGQHVADIKAAAVVFPEGTRARRGALKKFRIGGFSKLREALPDAEIIPVTVDGSWRFSAFKRGPIPRNTRVTFIADAALDSAPTRSDEEILNDAFEIIRTNLNITRGQEA